MSYSLLEVLLSRNQQLGNQAERLIEGSHRLLEFTPSTFPTGTDHTARHTKTVEVIGRMMLSDDFLAALNDQELFFLTVACHYHDLGMVGTERNDSTQEGRDQVRRDHAIRIGQKIMEKWAELGFENQRTAQILGEVCRGHRPTRNNEGEANWDELNALEILSPGIAVRVRLLAALIYAIDELHLGADRAPAFVMNWRDIEDEESRRHWRRHQAVHGPVIAEGGQMLYQVDADTPRFEENLRAEVFRKALGAVEDLRRQAKIEHVTALLPGISIQWNRTKTWDALLLSVASDLRPRTRDELEQAVFDRYSGEVASRTDLSGLCIERVDSEVDLRQGICRCLGDAITSARLIPAPDCPAAYRLSVTEPVALEMFTRLHDADELDRLYVGPFQGHWEEQFFDSSYGREYVTNCVLPAVERSYSVPLRPRPPTDPIRTLLESCPTATRLVLLFRPSPSNLVKEVLLTHAALTGALYDLHAAPERLLNGDLRTVIRALGGSNPEIAPTLRLLEEMALVGGFTTKQVFDAQHLSEAARQALETQFTSSTQGFLIDINQTVPADAPPAANYFPYLHLASQRSGTPIRLATAPGHDLTIRVTSEAALPMPTGDPSMIEIGPSGSRGFGPIRVPARIELSRPSRTIRFSLSHFGATAPTPCPVIVSVPPPPRSGTSSTATFGVSIHWPMLTIRDLRTLEAASQIVRTGRFRAELVIEGTGQLLASMSAELGGELFRMGGWNAEVLRGVRGLDGNLPAPLFVPCEQIAELGLLTPSDRCEKWKIRREARPEKRPLKTSIFLRLADAAGKPMDEVFLGFLPGKCFPPPSIRSGEAMSQEEFDRRWDTGDEYIQMTSFFENDVYDLAKALREWSSSPREEFPFRFGSNGPQSPVTRSALSTRFMPRIDRVWHWEQPVMFEFRPVNREEAYKLEADYWRSIDDLPRAELADEIRARLVKEATNHPAASGPRPQTAM